MACKHAQEGDRSSDSHADDKRQQGADQAGSLVLIVRSLSCALNCKHAHEPRTASQEDDDGFYPTRNYFRFRRLMKTRMGKAIAITAKIIVMFMSLKFGRAHRFDRRWAETCAPGACE